MNDTLLRRKLEKSLADFIMNESEALAIGIANDYADYKWRCGKVAAYKDIVVAIETISKEIDGE